MTRLESLLFCNPLASVPCLPQIYDLLAGGRDQDADKLDVKQVGTHVLPVPVLSNCMKTLQFNHE
jgi:hypothetical protein